MNWTSCERSLKAKLIKNNEGKKIKTYTRIMDYKLGDKKDRTSVH
jgi:hypothetical protein